MLIDDLENLTLAELADAVERLLGDAGLKDAVADGRVSPAPDARTVRYYTTLGILDRPRIADRQARYGRRHVLQLLAIKALQAQSLPLAAIQTRLYGKSEAELHALVATARKARADHPAPVRTVVWREVVIEPGLKLLAQEGWTPANASASLEERIRAALAALGPREGEGA